MNDIRPRRLGRIVDIALFFRVIHAQDPRAREPVLRMLELYRRIIGASVAAAAAW